MNLRREKNIYAYSGKQQASFTAHHKAANCGDVFGDHVEGPGGEPQPEEGDDRAQQQLAEREGQQELAAAAVDGERERRASSSDGLGGWKARDEHDLMPFSSECFLF